MTHAVRGLIVGCTAVLMVSCAPLPAIEGAEGVAQLPGGAVVTMCGQQFEAELAARYRQQRLELIAAVSTAEVRRVVPGGHVRCADALQDRLQGGDPNSE